MGLCSMRLSLSLGVGLGLSLSPMGMAACVALNAGSVSDERLQLHGLCQGMVVFARRYSSAAPSAVLPAAGKAGEA